MIKHSKIIRKIGSVMTLIFVLSLFYFPMYANASSNFTANVMAPLHVDNWNQFQTELNMAKNMGVDAVSVDVWWGDVEKRDNSFDWSYYDTIFSKIRYAGLKIVPIMSFHQCGGNVGDSYVSYVPSWVWNKYGNRYYNGMWISSNDLKYKSELGNLNSEFVSLWFDDLVKSEYIDFMNAFENHFGSYASSFLELNISTGPAGELRYPSYNSHDSGNTFSGYPNKGYFQCYSTMAKKSFSDAMMSKYGSLYSLNAAWGTSISNASQISPPTDGANFIYGYNKSYLNTTYGRDFIAWYNNELVQHGRNMINYAEQSFNGQLSGIQLGIKIPGVHWQINNSQYPRTAEITAGLIDTNFSWQNGYGYKNIISMVGSFNDVILHFTCLEMSNGVGEYTSAPKTLVGWVGDAANGLGVEIKGENALNGGNDGYTFWQNINDAIDNHYYNGLTILRMNDAVYGQSYNYYRDLINKNN